MASARVLPRLKPSRAVLLLCDMQEKFRGSVAYFPAVVQVSKRMLDGCRLLDIPAIATEQYPKGRYGFLVHFHLVHSVCCC